MAVWPHPTARQDIAARSLTLNTMAGQRGVIRSCHDRFFSVFSRSWVRLAELLASRGEAIPKSVLPRSRRLPKARSQAQRIALGDIALRLFVLTCVSASIA